MKGYQPKREAPAILKAKAPIPNFPKETGTIVPNYCEKCFLLDEFLKGNYIIVPMQFEKTTVYKITKYDEFIEEMKKKAETTDYISELIDEILRGKKE